MLGDLLAAQNIAASATLLSPPAAFDAAGGHICAAGDLAGCAAAAAPPPANSTLPSLPQDVRSVPSPGGLSPGGAVGVAAGAMLLLATLTAVAALLLAPHSRLLRAALAYVRPQAGPSKQAAGRRRRRQPVPVALQFDELHHDHHRTAAAADTNAAPPLTHLRLNPPDPAAAARHSAPRAVANSGGAGREAPAPFWCAKMVDWDSSAGGEAAAAGGFNSAAVAAADSHGGVYGAAAAEQWQWRAPTQTSQAGNPAELQLTPRGESALRLTPGGLPRHLIPYLVHHAAAAASTASATPPPPPPGEGGPAPPRPTPLPALFFIRPAERARTASGQPACSPSPSSSQPPLGAADAAVKKQRRVGAARQGWTPREALAARSPHGSPLPGAAPALSGVHSARPAMAFSALSTARTGAPSSRIGFLLGPSPAAATTEPGGGAGGWSIRGGDKGVGGARNGAVADLVLVSELGLGQVQAHRAWP